jgi:predicted  nucleic acid-binding Zn-ribbon protein
MTKKIDVDDATAVRAAELVALLSNPADYQRWLAEMRGVIASADAKLAAANEAAVKSVNAKKLFADATKMLGAQQAREQELKNREADLREREEKLAAQIRAADAEHVRQKADLTARAKLLDQRAEHLEGARKIMRNGIQRLRDEWAALKKVGQDIEALHTLH